MKQETGMMERELGSLYTRIYGTAPASVDLLPGSGSYRSYFRISGLTGTVIGAHNNDVSENEAFISFTNHFLAAGLPVPEILGASPDKKSYILTDLGDTTLYQYLTEERNKYRDQQDNKAFFPPKVAAIYRKSITWLPYFQVTAGKTLDYSKCYPRAAFDRQSMMWDLNYFKYYFLKLSRVPFDEQALEDDFNRFCDLLLQADSSYFLFRDFQSRNIMVLNGEPWFIDYQGGRKGALQYDIASILLDAKAAIPEPVRKEMLNHYLDELDRVLPVDRGLFLRHYDAFVLIRILQALGAYGFRGYYEGKTHFLQSIPFALENLGYLLQEGRLEFGLKELEKTLVYLVENKHILIKQNIEKKDHNNLITNDLNLINTNSYEGAKLTVTVHSFSYRKGMPTDLHGNGGGFVFDCRGLPNPGRLENLRMFDGRDAEIIEYLKNYPEVDAFISGAWSLVSQTIRNYLDRGFEHLMVSFGCTGGQHRSVFCAEAMAQMISGRFDIPVTLVHMERKKTD